MLADCACLCSPGSFAEVETARATSKRVCSLVMLTACTRSPASLVLPADISFSISRTAAVTALPKLVTHCIAPCTTWAMSASEKPAAPAPPCCGAGCGPGSWCFLWWW